METDHKSAGRDSGGKFTKGNKAAKGNPYTRKAAQFRKAMYNSVSEQEFRQIVDRMKQDALNGSAKDRELFLTRLLGTPGTGIDILERMERLEAILQEQEERERSEDSE